MTTPEIVTARELATHAADIKHMKSDMDAMIVAMKDMNATLVGISSTLSEAKGGWRMLMMFGAAGGVVGSALTGFLNWIPNK
jgi:hypothetical protein